MSATIMGWDQKQWEIAETYFNLRHDTRAVSLEFTPWAFNSKRQFDAFHEVRRFWMDNKNHQPGESRIITDLSGAKP